MLDRMSAVTESAHTGRSLRDAVPRSSHAAWNPPAGRVSPVELLKRQAATRVPELVPIRHARMLVSPFSYFRGAALPMAADLAGTPSSGITVQLCGDAHLSNFGIFGSAERRLVFDVNDFDETAPGPWEWDVKRLAASLEIAGRDAGFSQKERTRTVLRSMRSYRETMREFAELPMLEVWYAHLDMDAILPRFQLLLDRRKTPAVWHAISKARAHDSMQAFEKLCVMVDGRPRIVSDPPLIVPFDNLYPPGADPSIEADWLHTTFTAYQATLNPARRRLVGQYTVEQLARKVVGVGSVGTRSYIALLLDQAHSTPLFLQIKQAEASVLEEFTAPSEYENHAQRVVMGQRLMQASSDIFLGWERVSWESVRGDYYVRQLRDWKGSADVGTMTREGMELWARMCGWTLARAHARSGDRVAIAAYLGKRDTFDQALAAFAVAYAEQNELDYAAMQAAVARGELPFASPART